MFPWNRPLEKIWTWPHKFWINIFLWWAEEIENENWKRLAIRSRAVMLVFNFAFILSLMANIFVETIKNGLMTSLFTIFAALPGAIGTAKLIVFIIHRERLVKAMNELDELLLDAIEDGIVPNVEKKIRKHFSRAWILFYFMLISGSMITGHWILRPIMLAFSGIKTSIVITYPNPIDTWEQVILTFSFQVFNIITIGHAIYLFDNFFFGMAEAILVQFTILKHQLRNMEISKNGSDSLKSCVERHESIMRICITLKDSSTFIIIFQCFHSVLLLCSGVFQLSMGNVNLQVLINLSEITLIIVIILYCYCWYSNEITYQCKECLTYFYMTKWEEGQLQDKKSLLTMMSMTMRPVEFGGILKIDLNTFIDVLKTTFSYYNFLTAVNQPS